MMSNHNFKTVDSSRVSISQLMQPSHSNFGGKIHGGFILGMMDQIAFACASKHSETYCVTASVDTVDFLNPIEIGELDILKGSAEIELIMLEKHQWLLVFELKLKILERVK